MTINILKALRIYTSKKDFIVYTLKDNTLDKYILTNDLTRHRKSYGEQSKFLLVDILKQQLNNITLNL